MISNYFFIRILFVYYSLLFVQLLCYLYTDEKMCVRVLFCPRLCVHVSAQLFEVDEHSTSPTIFSIVAINMNDLADFPHE